MGGAGRNPGSAPPPPRLGHHSSAGGRRPLLKDTDQSVSPTSLVPSAAAQSCLCMNRSTAFSPSSISGGAEENSSSYPHRRHRIRSGAGSGGPVAHERNLSRWALLVRSVTGQLDLLADTKGA